ncbi:MAG: sulfatase-like hydrolase/transferase [Planctomycetota bacterium]|jgi:arylsulfatase A-like enzyme
MTGHKITRRDFLESIGLGLPFVAMAGLSSDKAFSNISKAGKPPNIVIIMTDQQQARCSKREGFALDTTPSLDKLARQGAWFNRAYTSAPLCAPARVSMFTGRFPDTHGVRANPTVHISTRYGTSLIEVLKEAGYKTALIGKNHSHLKADDFDHYFLMSHDGGRGPQRTSEEKVYDKWLKDLRHGVSDVATPFPLRCQLPHRIVTDACRWVRKIRSRQPFFMWMSFPEPHNPYQIPEPYFSMFPPEKNPPVLAGKEAIKNKGFKWQFVSKVGRMGLKNYDKLLPRMRSNYYGMLRLIDDQVNRFVTTLETEQMRDNTFIFFVSDHGDFVGDYGLMRKGPELPEDLVRVPFFVNGPGIKPDVHPREDCVSIVDIMPTICEIIAKPLPKSVQGRSLWPILSGGDYPKDEFTSAYAEGGFGGLNYNWDDNPDFNKALKTHASFDCLNQYSQAGIMRMLRKGDWKLIYDMQGNGQLYNLKNDPAELKNLFDDKQYIQLKCDMLAELLAQTLRAQDPIPYPDGDYERKTHPRNYWSPGS